jgi:DNA-binding FadR family transcriptional regulator
VREALRILEIQNLIRKRAGRAGGAIVQRPTTKSIAASLTMVIRGRQIKLADVMETREALEPFCAQLAARNRIDDDLAVLDRADADIANADIDQAAFLKASLDWHVAVAMATHNELLIGFMTALAQAVYVGSENAAFIDDIVRTVAARAHRSITEAIRSRDASAAARRMRRHVRGHADAALGTQE